MARTRIASSALSDYILLSSAGQQIVRAYPQLRQELRSTLGEEHAALLAQPVLGERARRIDWYADGEGVPLASLEPTVQAAVQARLVRLYDGITTHAAALRASDRSQSLNMAAFLEQAMRVPDLDAVRVVGDQPVLVNWGAKRSGQQAEVHPLQLLSAQHQESTPLSGSAPVGGGAETGQAAGGEEPGVRERGKGGLWASLVLGVVLLGLCAVVSRMLLQSCAVGLPSFLRGAGEMLLWDTCTVDDTYAHRLGKIIAAAQADIETANAACGVEEETPAEDPDVIVDEELQDSEMQYRIAFVRPFEPNIGTYCLTAVCDNDTLFRRARNSDGNFDENDVCIEDPPPSVIARAPSDSSGMCHVIAWPVETVIMDPTPFSGEVALEIDGERAQTWAFESTSPEQPLATQLQERGQYRSYYIGTFEFPHPDAAR